VCVYIYIYKSLDFGVKDKKTLVYEISIEYFMYGSLKLNFVGN
jgi:hypothetical protein